MTRHEVKQGEMIVTKDRGVRDKINPSHYKTKSSMMEVIDVIVEFELDFILGNTVKYILRNGKKSGESSLDDLKKASWYLDRKIKELEGGT